MFYREAFYSSLVLILFSTSGYSQELIDRVVISIEGEPITQLDVEQYARDTGKDLGLFSTSDPKVQEVMQELVVQRLLDKEAKALNITVSNDEVETYLSEIRRQNGVDEETFKGLLVQRGITWGSYLEQVRTDIIKNRVVSARVRSKINVVDEDINRYLESQPALKPVLGSRRVFELYFGNSLEEAQSRYQELKQRIASAKEFNPETLQANGAKDLGYVLLEDLRQDIGDAIESTKDLELSPLVAIDEKQKAFFVVATISDNVNVDAILEKEISAKVYEMKFNERLKEFLDVELPSRYHVEQL